jgi:hypothetical protein
MLIRDDDLHDVNDLKSSVIQTKNNDTSLSIKVECAKKHRLDHCINEENADNVCLTASSPSIPVLLRKKVPINECRLLVPIDTTAMVRMHLYLTCEMVFIRFHCIVLEVMHPSEEERAYLRYDTWREGQSRLNILRNGIDTNTFPSVRAIDVNNGLVRYTLQYCLFA